MTDQAIEAEIQAKGLTAPRITPQDVEDTIVHEMYVTGDELGRGWCSEIPREGPLPKTAETLRCLTICVLVLRNGFTVTGESACASPENFDAELGRKIARRNAADKIGALEGYQLRTRLAQGA